VRAAVRTLTAVGLCSAAIGRDQRRSGRGQPRKDWFL